MICFPDKNDFDEEKVAEMLPPQDENQDPAGRQPEKMNELIQAETLECSSTLKDGLVHEEFQSELKLKIVRREEVSSFNVTVITVLIYIIHLVRDWNYIKFSKKYWLLKDGVSVELQSTGSS